MRYAAHGVAGVRWLIWGEWTAKGRMRSCCYLIDLREGELGWP